MGASLRLGGAARTEILAFAIRQRGYGPMSNPLNTFLHRV